MNSPYMFHHREWGDRCRPTVVFLHGFMGNSGDWDEIAELLADRFHCLAVDLPGHGATNVDGPDSLYRMEATAEALMAWLAAMNIDSAYLVGYSMGGRLALYLASRWRARWESVVLESASPGLATAAERQARCEHDRVLAQRLLTIRYDRFLDQWYNQPLFANIRRDPVRFEKLLADREDVDTHGFARSLLHLGTGSQPSVWDSLGLILPSLLLVGEMDAKFRDIAVRMAVKMRAATVTVVAGAGHNVHFEQPEKYASLVRSFLTQ